MKKNKAIVLILLPILFLSCGPVPLGRMGGDSFDWDWGSGSFAKSITDPAPDQANLIIAFGIKAAQSGILVAGNSTEPNKTMDYAVQTLAKDGTTILGTLAKSETFDVSDPSIINIGSLPAGTEVTPPYSLFLNRIGTATRTRLRLGREPIPYNPIQGKVDKVNEVVLRIANDSFTDSEGYKVITQPHFIYTKGGETESYASAKGNLIVNGDADYFKNFEYIAFVPKYIVGQDFYYMVKGPIQDPDTATWLTDYSGNATIFAMIDKVAGMSSPTNAQREANATWQSTAKYFQGYLSKYYKSKCMMFNATFSSSVLFVAMNETLRVGPDQGIQVNVDFSGSTINIVSSNMTITGDPPFVFSTSLLK